MTQTDRMIDDIVYKGWLYARVLLALSLFLISTAVYAQTQEHVGFTVRVQVKEPVTIALRNLSEYVHVVAVRDHKGNALKMGAPVKVKQGYRIDIEIREGVEVLRFSKPVRVLLYAPLYLGKEVQVTSVSGADLAGQKATVEIPKDGLNLTVEASGTINYLNQNRRVLDDTVSLTFKDEEVLARAHKPIGMQPVRKKSFELLDRWVSPGEQLRIRVPIPNVEKTSSHLAVGFWTDHPESAMEEDAYLSDITGIEPEKTGGNTYIVKARVPHLSQLQHVVPSWYSPYPPTVKMTVTTRLDDSQVVSETFDVRVTRRGWGVAAGLIFLLVVLMTIMHVTRNYNPFDETSVRYQKWRETYKSSGFKRFFFSPLDLAVTPFGTYSISVAQALFWTFIVAFSCVYVYMLKAAFIVISDQILILLGISGGTALASRVNAMSRDVVPKELMKEIDKEDIPRLRDMISIAGKLNIYKFQMLVFTLITGGIVLVELIKASNFPEIPNTLIVLMGLSNTLYLGNEVTVEPVEGLREKVKAYKEEADAGKKKAIGNEIKRMLSQY